MLTIKPPAPAPRKPHCPAHTRSGVAGGPPLGQPGGRGRVQQREQNVQTTAAHKADRQQPSARGGVPAPGRHPPNPGNGLRCRGPIAGRARGIVDSLQLRRAPPRHWGRWCRWAKRFPWVSRSCWPLLGMRHEDGPHPRHTRCGGYTAERRPLSPGHPPQMGRGRGGRGGTTPRRGRTSGTSRPPRRVANLARRPSPREPGDVARAGRKE